ncbi:hypothetical protein RIF29_13851 [Crotalaria pallida]|uniref:F-box domain-containing protein n=1 Tax=Crotalaria pallida TaxID=3830 RepID=A0AAN9FCP9_CROPI
MDKKKRVVVPHLPDDLIVLILLRLPVKSLLRFKCVSKSFFSLISDNQFAISHFDLAASPTHRLLCSAGTAFASRSLDLDDDSSSLPLIPRFLPPSCTPQIKGSCNGFILLTHRSPHHLYIWNPSTGAHKKLPLSPNASSDPNKHFPIYYGFGYDASTNDYLVFLGSLDFNVEVLWKTDYELFSLRANAWKTIEVEVLPLPPSVVDVNNFFRGHSNLCVLDGYLCLCVPRNNATEIWVMNEYEVSSSWKKCAELCMTSEAIDANDGPPHPYISPIYSTKCGDIVGLNSGARVVKFNAKGQMLEHHSFRVYRRIMYTESLLSFSFPS